jgi:uncharacterized membrane-anchored protein
MIITCKCYRCKKCHKALILGDLDDSEDGVGKVCVNTKSCAERIEKKVLQQNI